jgi:hypothetical protein
MIETAGDLVTFCLRASGLNGVGQTPSSEDANTGLQLLNSMLATWQRRRWLVWSLVDTALMSTGAASYSVGISSPASNFAIARPDRIEAAYARLLPGSGALSVDYPLGLIPSAQDYAAITMKGLTTFPGAVYYEPAFPVGLLHFWPISPAGQFELHILTKATLPQLTHLTDLVSVPPEYMEALIWSLCVRLAMAYGLDPKPSHVGAMRAAMSTIRIANAAPRALALPHFGAGRGFAAPGGDGTFILDSSILDGGMLA